MNDPAGTILRDLGYDPELVDAEIGYCTQAHDTRSGWTVADLKAVTPDTVHDVIEDLRRQSIDLATTVARNLIASPDGLRDRILLEAGDQDIDVDDDALDDLDIAGLVTWARDRNLTIDDGQQGHPDGYTVTGSEAVAYASMRVLRPDVPCWVTIDLLTGETEDH